MAKAVSTKKKYKHIECVNCRPVLHKFLSNTREPILGECEYNEYMFLLREDTDCPYFKR